MNNKAHLEELNRKHHDLKQAISEGYNHFLPDAQLQHLKKERLRMKEEIYHFKRTASGQ